MAHVGFSFLCVRFAVKVEFGTGLLSVIFAWLGSIVHGLEL